MRITIKLRTIRRCSLNKKCSNLVYAILLLMIIISQTSCQDQRETYNYSGPRQLCYRNRDYESWYLQFTIKPRIKLFMGIMLCFLSNSGESLQISIGDGHGIGQFSKTWETTPDGREDSEHLFTPPFSCLSD